MASGIYIHFPFCVSKCNYCAFYSSTNFAQEKQYYKRLKEQIIDSFSFCEEDNPTTLYFGGGTPSLFDLSVMSDVILQYKSRYNIEEITVEMNPAEVTQNYLFKLKEMGVNRVSLGVQSLNDIVLKFLGRRHSSKMAKDAIELVSSYFENFSIDFIISIPNFTINYDEIEKLLKDIKIPHISVYGLSVEEGTKFFNDGIVTSGEQFSTEYQEFSQFLTNLGYEHYEVSNFCKPKMQSKHNSKYWLHNNYLGLGSSAHSFWNGKRFFFDEDFFSKSLTEKFELSQIISDEELEEEKLMLLLRMKDGVDKSFVKNQNRYKTYLKQGFLKEYSNKVRFTPLGWTVFDPIFVDVFLL